MVGFDCLYWLPSISTRHQSVQVLRMKWGYQQPLHTLPLYIPIPIRFSTINTLKINKSFSLVLLLLYYPLLHDTYLHVNLYLSITIILVSIYHRFKLLILNAHRTSVSGGRIPIVTYFIITWWMDYLTFFVLFFAKFDTNRIRTRVMNNNIINIDVKIMFLFFYNFKKISAK